MRPLQAIGFLVSAALVVAGCAPRGTEPLTESGWPMYRADLAGTGYSSLSEITTENVADLGRVWSYSLLGETAGTEGGQAEPRSAYSQATP